MHRRAYLAGVTTALGSLAGCAGGSEANGSNPSGDEEVGDAETPRETATPEPTPTATPTATVTPLPTPDLRVRIRYAGEWQGSVGTSQQQRSIDGEGDRVVDVPDDATVVTVNAQKRDDSPRTLTVAILADDEVVLEQSTTAEYGVAQVSESFF
jgi:hypothetical protein